MYIENEMNNPSFKLSNDRFCFLIPHTTWLGCCFVLESSEVLRQGLCKPRAAPPRSKRLYALYMLLYTLWFELSRYPTS